MHYWVYKKAGFRYAMVIHPCSCYGLKPTCFTKSFPRARSLTFLRGLPSRTITRAVSSELPFLFLVFFL